MPDKSLNKKEYVAKKKREKANAKNSTVKDMNQDYELKELKKDVHQLMKGTKSWSVQRGNSQIIGSFLNATFNDSTIANFTVTNPADIGNANVQSRFLDGPTIDIGHIGFNYSIDMDPDSAMDEVGASMIIRVLAFVMHQPVGEPANGQAALPNLNDILLMSQTSGTPLTSADVLAHYTRSARQNIEVLYDKTHILTPVYANPTDLNFPTSAAGSVHTGEHRVSMKPSKRSRTVTYTDPNGLTGYAAQGHNQYFIIAFTDNPEVGNNNPPTITWNMVVDYIE
jgi:hypothetical protein